MDFLQHLFTDAGTATTILYLSLTAIIGVLIGKIEIKKVKLGIAGVLFSGLLLAHWGAQIDPHILHFVREFGLILFVYAIGIDVGPRFFRSFKEDGFSMNMFAIAIVVSGFLIALGIYTYSNLSPSVVTGIMSGAVTNTPGLGAAQQALSEFGKADDAIAMGYAVAYPFGVVGIILTMLLIRLVFKVNIPKEIEDYNAKSGGTKQKLESVKISVSNPNMFGKEVRFIKEIVDKELVISRIERNGTFILASEHERVYENDLIYGVSSLDYFESLRLKMGDIELCRKREISGDLAMFHVLITNRKIAGKTIGQIGIYRRYEANITRIFRAGVEILPTSDATIELGDTVRVVGKRELLPEIRQELGNSVKELAHPNILPIFLGVFLGIILGSVPLFIPGLPAPAKLGMAGGPLLVAILLGHKGRIKKLDFYMTPGANMMIKELGIILFLSCVGLSSGAKFVETIQNGGYVWLLYGALITFVPILIVGVVARLRKVNYLKICGILAGSMTDPPALEFANSIAPIPAQATAYATVYPLTMFLRILLAQTLILVTL